MIYKTWQAEPTPWVRDRLYKDRTRSGRKCSNVHGFCLPVCTGRHLCISSGLPWCTDVSKLAVKCVTQVTTVKGLKITEDVLSSRRSRRSSPCHPITRNSPGSECVFWAWSGVGKSCLASLSNVYASGPPVNTRGRSEEKRTKLNEVKELSLGWFLIYISDF